MDPDRLAHMAVHGASTWVMWHWVCLIHQAVGVCNDVDKRKSKLLAADARRAKGDAPHICCGELDCCPVRTNGAEAAANGVPAACDSPGNVTLQSNAGLGSTVSVQQYPSWNQYVIACAVLASGEMATVDWLVASLICCSR